MTAPVSFIRPLTIVPSMITSTTAVTKLPAEGEWSAMGTYTKGQVVFRTAVGRRFENKIPGMNGNLPEEDRERWYDLGATDQTTMFDAEVSSESIAPDVLTTVFRPGAFNAGWLLKLTGTSLTFTVKDAPGGATVFTETISLEDSQPDDYWEHLFDPYRPRTEYLVTGLEPYMSCEVTVSIAFPGSVARCGMASLGDLVSVGGLALTGATAEPKSYSRIVTDERGKTSIETGKSALDLTGSCLVALDVADTVVDALRSTLGVPCPWILTDSQNMRSLRGFGLGTFKLTYDTTDKARLSYNISGMI